MGIDTIKDIIEPHKLTFAKSFNLLRPLISAVCPFERTVKMRAKDKNIINKEYLGVSKVS